jgi:hypothetical protein
MFRNAFEVLSFTFDGLSTQEVEDWILGLNDPKLNELWARQKYLKYPGFIFYFAMWHFRDRVLQEKEYSREVLETRDPAPRSSARSYEMPDPINRELAVLSTFEGIAFLGSLIAAWMLSCPKALIVSATDSMQTPQASEIWIKTMFPDALGTNESKDELELLYKLDYRLYYTFADLEARNTE